MFHSISLELQAADPLLFHLDWRMMGATLLIHPAAFNEVAMESIRNKNSRVYLHVYMLPL